MPKLNLLTLSFLAVSCSTAASRPCADGGDVSWNPPLKGDRRCYQKDMGNGRFVNHGQFLQYFPNGKVQLEGDFKEGQKNGYWIQYDEQGRKIAERYFEAGVERATAAGLKK